MVLVVVCVVVDVVETVLVSVDITVLYGQYISSMFESS